MDDWRMEKTQVEEARRRWVADLIAREREGNKADFARRIGKDSSYVSRMLYPPGKDGGKAIGEDMMRAIIQAFPSAQPPPSDAAVPLFTPERRADDDVVALQIALESLTLAVLKRTPGAASEFLTDVENVALRRKFSTKHGLLGVLAGIAEEVRRGEVEEDATPPHGGSARRKKP